MIATSCPILITAGDAGPAGAAEIDAGGLVWRSGPSFWRSETRLVWARVQALDPIGREQARNRGRDGKGALRSAALTAGGAAFGLVGAIGGAITAAIWSAAEDIPSDRALVLLRTFDDRFAVFTCGTDALPAIALWYGRGGVGALAAPAAGPVLEARLVPPAPPPIQMLLAPPESPRPAAPPESPRGGPGVGEAAADLARATLEAGRGLARRLPAKWPRKP